MINRQITNRINELKNSFPVIVVTGPRQSGKTTLIREMFPEYTYYNLESPQTLKAVQDDPAGLVNPKTHKIIIDEVQRAPELLSYIQVAVDEQHIAGNFILSGSENLLLSEKINQSLAGRAAYVNLLPLSYEELKDAGKEYKDLYKQLFTGQFPALYSKKYKPFEYFEQYIATYVERDVKQISNVINLTQFRKFLGLIAGRIGQMINNVSLANDVGVSPNTIENWISILEASYIIFRLQPYYENFGKRHIKSPKIYFTDTGLACRLLDLTEPEQLKNFFLIGGLFENFVILEIKKFLQNIKPTAKLFYFRDTHGNEIDLIIDQGTTQIPVEIKSGSTFSLSFLKGIRYWNDIVGEKSPKEVLPGFVVYSGSQLYKTNEYSLIKWKELNQIFQQMK
jgi:predicted AAA+ superfamily ATPase